MALYALGDMHLSLSTGKTIAEEYGAEHVVYSHCHGESRFGDSIRGTHHGIHYHLVSGDYLHFKPEKILP